MEKTVTYFLTNYYEQTSPILEDITNLCLHPLITALGRKVVIYQEKNQLSFSMKKADKIAYRCFCAFIAFALLPVTGLGLWLRQISKYHIETYIKEERKTQEVEEQKKRQEKKDAENREEINKRCSLISSKNLSNEAKVDKLIACIHYLGQIQDKFLREKTFFSILEDLISKQVVEIQKNNLIPNKILKFKRALSYIKWEFPSSKVLFYAHDAIRKYYYTHYGYFHFFGNLDKKKQVPILGLSKKYFLEENLSKEQIDALGKKASNCPELMLHINNFQWIKPISLFSFIHLVEKKEDYFLSENLPILSKDIEEIFTETKRLIDPFPYNMEAKEIINLYTKQFVEWKIELQSANNQEHIQRWIQEYVLQDQAYQHTYNLYKQITDLYLAEPEMFENILLPKIQELNKIVEILSKKGEEKNIAWLQKKVMQPLIDIAFLGKKYKKLQLDAAFYPILLSSNHAYKNPNEKITKEISTFIFVPYLKENEVRRNLANQKIFDLEVCSIELLKVSMCYEKFISLKLAKVATKKPSWKIQFTSSKK